MSQETIERDFTFSGPARLTLSNIRGSVNIERGEAGVITVTATKHIDTGDAEQTVIEIDQSEDGEVVVKTRVKEGGFMGITRNKVCKVDYRVSIPHTCVLRIDCVSSSLSAEGLKGAFTLKTVSGKVRLQSLGGRIKVGTVSGDISGGEISGSIDISTVSGNIRLEASNLTSMEVSTVSGDLKLHTPLSEEIGSRFKTVSGNVRLVLPEEAGCTVEINSISGRLKTALPHNGTKKSRRRGRFEILGGGPSVHFSTVSGNLFVEIEGGSASKTAPAPVKETPAAVKEPAPVPRPAPRNRREILDLIAQGALSAQEGLAELKKL